MVEEKQLGNVEYFSCWSSMITNDARCTQEIKSRIAMAKADFKTRELLFTSKLDLNLGKKLVKCCMWNTALCGAENRIL
jgi:hypothetical protein